jgi:hypothetical protein
MKQDLPIGKSFLYQHYADYRNAGGDHVEYEIWNEISREVAEQLRAEYDRQKAAAR